MQASAQQPSAQASFHKALRVTRNYLRRRRESASQIDKRVLNVQIRALSRRLRALNRDKQQP